MSEATLPEPIEQEPSASQEEGPPPCEKCGAPSDAAACPSCGWYPVLGVHVEIDAAFEACMRPAPAAEEGAPVADQKESLAKHLEVWRGAIPAWGWVMIATAGGIFAAGVAARVATVEAPSLQTLIGVGGLVGGLALLLLTHVVGFILVSSENADSGVADILIKPLKSWARLLGELPARLWLSNTGLAGLTTALTAALVVGGIPYERLLDWNFKAPPKQNLVGMIASQAAQMGEGKHDSMEEAMGDFAGQAGVDGLGDGGPPQPAAPRERVDCLILGFRLTDAGALDTLLLAAGGSDNKLRYIGAVRPALDEEEEASLLKKFAGAGSARPFVTTQMSAQWLRPKFTCRATYAEWPQGRRPRDLKWDSLLDEVKLPW